MGPDSVEIKPVGGALGAELVGLNLREEITEQVIDFIRRALDEHLVVFVPGQHLDRDRHVEFASHFGDLEVFHPSVEAEDTHPQIMALHSEQGLIADLWHTDVTWSESPPIASILRVTVNPSRGGDTMWSNQFAAFEGLTAPMREMLLGLTACHTAVALGYPDRRAVHPVVRSHPETGRACLYVNRQFTSHIVELSPAESDVLLDFLFTWSEQPQFTCRYSWAVGTVAMWDNRWTQHYVVNDFDEPRTMERITVMGDTPEPAAATTWPAYDYGQISASAGPAIRR